MAGMVPELQKPEFEPDRPADRRIQAKRTEFEPAAVFRFPGGKAAFSILRIHPLQGTEFEAGFTAAAQDGRPSGRIPAGKAARKDGHNRHNQAAQNRNMNKNNGLRALWVA